MSILDSATRRLLDRTRLSRVVRLPFNDAGHGFDTFGMRPASVAFWMAMLRPFYKHYFRVESQGAEHIPREGAAILAANHSGALPVDGVMLVADVLENTEPPRLPRPIGDMFIPLLPIVSTVFSRAGVVSGSRGNVRHLLRSGELVLIFPEGVRGLGKGYAQRYRLQEWHPGHAELAIEHGVPVIPVGVVGAEEAWPLATKLEQMHWFNSPWLPLPATPMPLPVRVHIRYGEPIRLHERWTKEQAWDPDVSREAAGMVKDAVAQLIQAGLRDRKGLFR